MAKPIAVQLYTVREALAHDFEGVVRKIATLGYIGVEPYRFSGTTAQAAADLFQSLGLQVPAAHSPLPVGDQREEVLETMRLFGCKYLVCPSMPRGEFMSVAGIIGVCERLNEANAVTRDAGLTLVYHNHEFEYQQVEGVYPYKVMAEHLDPTIGFEIDTYWVKTGGVDPVGVVKELGARAPLLHIKDGPCVREQPMVAVGDGKMDFPPLIEAAKSAEWMIVELDACATDMMEAVAKSYTYLVGKGLASGNKS